MRKILIKLGIGLSLVGFGWLIAEQGDNYISETTLKESEVMCKNAVVSEGIVESNYSQTTIKVGKLETKMYTFNYSYQVDGISYKGSYTRNKIEGMQKLKIWYDKNNPSKSVSTEPCQTYSHYKTKEYSPFKNWFYFIGIPMVLIGLGLLYNFVIEIIKFMIKSAKKPG